MVNTKDQSNAIVYCVCCVICWHCWHEDQSMQCIECYVSQYCWQWCLWLLHNTVYRVMRCENCTLLCIKWPHTPAKREGYLRSLPSCGFSCSPVWGGSFTKRSLSCIDSINKYSIEKPSVSAFQKFFRLKIGWILRKLWAEMCGCVLTLLLWPSYWQCQQTRYHTQYHCFDL